MSRLFALVTLLALASLFAVKVVDACGIRGNGKIIPNDADSMASTKRSLQGGDCPCDCTDSLDNGAEKAFLIQGPLGNAFCVPASAWADILIASPGIVCSPDEEVEQGNGGGTGCTKDFIVVPIPGGGGGGVLPFDDTFQFDDALGLLDDALAFDDVVLPFTLP